jgi:uncharacterized membrane protein
MSLDDEQSSSSSLRWEYLRLYLSLGIFTFLGLLNLNIFLAGFEDVHLHFLYAHIFMAVLLLRDHPALWAYLLSIAIFDLLNGFASFNLPIIAIFYMCLQFLKRKNLGWSILNSWVVFAIFVLLFEILRHAFSALFAGAAINAELFLKTVSLQIVLFPFVVLCHKGLINQR